MRKELIILGWFLTQSKIPAVLPKEYRTTGVGKF